MKRPNDKVVTGIFGKEKRQQGRPSTTKQPTWPEVSRGKIVKTSIANVRAFLDYLGLKLWLNQFANRIRIDRSEKHQYLDNHVLSSLWGQANKLGFRPSKAFMRDALSSIAVDNGRHPLREFLKGLRWDGKPRAERLFIDYAHAEDNALNRASGKLLLVAMVRRIWSPAANLITCLSCRVRRGVRSLCFARHWRADRSSSKKASRLKLA